jgi:hypothetical protein
MREFCGSIILYFSSNADHSWVPIRRGDHRVEGDVQEHRQR